MDSAHKAETDDRQAHEIELTVSCRRGRGTALQLTMGTLKSAIDELRDILDSNRLAGVKDADAAVDGKWSRKQVLGHLLDSASNNHHRLVCGQFQDAVAMPGYEQDAWVAAGHYQDRQWDELVAWWSAYNRHLLHLMETTPAKRLNTQCRIGAGEAVTLEFLMVDYVRHLKHHLRQILS